MISQETICPYCQKTKFWLKENEPTVEGCPECGLRWIGVYNKNTLSLDAKLFQETKRKN